MLPAQAAAPGDALLPVLAPHAPVVVNGDADLASQGFTGSGAVVTDPCVLENVLIDAAGGANGIFMGNVTAKYFVIRNVQVINANGAGTGPYDQGAGITIYNSEKGQVLNSNISANRVGIVIYGGGDILVSQCSFYNNGAGVVINNITTLPSHSAGVTLYRNSFGGTYAVSKYAVQATSVAALRIDGNRFRSLTNNDGIVLKECTAASVVEDNDLKNFPGTAIHLIGGSNVTVRSNNVTGVLGTGIWIEQNFQSSAPMRNLAIVGNNCSNVSGNGLEVNVPTKILVGANIADNVCNGDRIGIMVNLGPNSHTNNIERNICNANSQAGILLMNFQKGSVQYNTCQFTGIDGGMGLAIMGTTTLPVSGTVNNVVSHNTLSHNPSPLMVTTGNNYNVIDSNDCSYGVNGINLQSSHNQVTNNVIYGSTGNDGIIIFTTGATDNIVQGNLITLPPGTIGAGFSFSSGIYVQGSAGSPAANNRILDNQIGHTDQYGVVVSYYDSGEISGNTIVGSRFGVAMDHSNNNSVSQNIIYAPAVANSAGFDLRYSSNNTYTGNMVSGMATYGMYVVSSNNNTITRNLLSANLWDGLYLIMGSTGNNIYLNSFEGNNPGGTSQAVDTGPSDANSWFSGGQGNYWSDHTSPDSEPDGYVDTPYTIAGSMTPQQDLYPLSFLIGPALTLSETHGFRTVNLTWSPSLYGTYISVDEYNIYRNGTIAPIATVPASTTQFIDTNLTAGFDYTYIVKASTGGLENPYGPSIIVTLPPENTNELVFSITSPANGANLTSGTVNLGWTTTAAGGTIYSISYDGGRTWASTTNLDYIIPVTLADTYFGQPYTVYVEARDPIGGQFETQMVQFYVDTAAPFVSSNLNAQSVFVNGSVPLSYRITDPGTGVVNDTVYLDGALIANNSYAATPYREYESPVDLGFPVNLTGGTHTVTIYAADAVGNLRMISYDFLVDSVGPSLVIASDLENNGNTNLPEVHFTWAGSSDPYTPLPSLQFMVKVDDGAWRSIGPANSYTTSTLQDGPHTSWLKGTDFAGNASIISLSFTLDSVGPAITAIAPASGSDLTHGVIDLTWTATDGDGLGIASHWYRLDSLAGQNLISTASSQAVTLTGVTSGNHMLKVWAVDAVGNWGPTMTIAFTMDASPPVTTADVTGTAGTNGWYTSPVSVTLTATDNTGVAKIQYRVGTTGAWQDYSTALAFDTDGIHVLQYNATDISGIVEVTKDLEIRVDTTMPATIMTVTGTPGTNGWYQSPIIIGLASSDAISGVAAIQYELDGSGWQNYTGIFEVSTSGNHTLSYHATDMAGNLETAKLFRFGIDKVAPVTSMTYSVAVGTSGGDATQVTVGLVAADDVSGVAAIHYRINGGAWSLYGPSIVLSGGSVNILEYNATDIAGNAELTHTLIVKIGTSAPELITRSPEGSSAPITSTVSAGFSGAMDQANTSLLVNGVTGTISWTGNKMVFTPNTNLSYNTTFAATVTTLTDNVLYANSWSFSTIAGKGTLTGLVVGPDGKPVAGATVLLGDQNTTTDSSGRYVLNATQGDYTLTIKAPGMADQTKQVTILPDLSTDSGTIGLSKAPGIDMWVWVLAILAIVIVLIAAFVVYRRSAGNKK